MHDRKKARHQAQHECGRCGARGETATVVCAVVVSLVALMATASARPVGGQRCPTERHRVVVRRAGHRHLGQRGAKCALQSQPLLRELQLRNGAVRVHQPDGRLGRERHRLRGHARTPLLRVSRSTSSRSPRAASPSCTTCPGSPSSCSSPVYTACALLTGGITNWDSSSLAADNPGVTCRTCPCSRSPRATRPGRTTSLRSGASTSSRRCGRPSSRPRTPSREGPPTA